MFWCPGCDGAHSINVGEGLGPRWTFNGDYDKPTFKPSIFVNKGQACPSLPACHSWVTDGQITFLADSTHKMAGQTVPLLDFDT